MSFVTAQPEMLTFCAIMSNARLPGWPAADCAPGRRLVANPY